MVNALLQLDLVVDSVKVLLLLLTSLTEARVRLQVILVYLLTGGEYILQVFRLLSHWHLDADLGLSLRLELRLVRNLLVEVLRRQQSVIVLLRQVGHLHYFHLVFLYHLENILNFCSVKCATLR